MSSNLLPSRNAQSLSKTAKAAKPTKAARPYSPKGSSDAKRKLLIIGGAALLLIGACYGVYRVYRNSQRQALIAQTAKDLEAKMVESHTLEVGGMWRRGRDEMGGLDRSGGRQAFGEAGAEYLKKFFGMSKEEQLAELNQAIDERLAEQKRREAERLAREAAEAAGVSLDGPTADSPQNGDNSNGNSTGGQGRRGPPSDQQRLQRSQRGKQNWSPEARSQMTVYHQMYQAQQQQRGISGGGGFF